MIGGVSQEKHLFSLEEAYAKKNLLLTKQKLNYVCLALEKCNMYACAGACFLQELDALPAFSLLHHYAQERDAGEGTHYLYKGRLSTSKPKSGFNTGFNPAGNPEYVQTTPAGHIPFGFWSLKSD